MEEGERGVEEGERGVEEGERGVEEGERGVEEGERGVEEGKMEKLRTELKHVLQMATETWAKMTAVVC